MLPRNCPLPIFLANKLAIVTQLPPKLVIEVSFIAAKIERVRPEEVSAWQIHFSFSVSVERSSLGMRILNLESEFVLVPGASPGKLRAFRTAVPFPLSRLVKFIPQFGPQFSGQPTLTGMNSRQLI